MINKERCSFIFLLILAILDQMNASLFSVDFTYSSLSFVSHLCFCGCILVVSHEKSLNRLLYACLCGLCVGLFFTPDWLVKMVLFGFFGWLSGLFKNAMDQDHWVQFALVFLMMFINDLICFLGAKLFGYLTMSFVKWFIHVEALTLIFNGAWIFVLLYIITVFNRYATIKNIRFKRMEKLHMQNIRRKWVVDSFPSFHMC